jgi:hypothetical protein
MSVAAAAQWLGQHCPANNFICKNIMLAQAVFSLSIGLKCIANVKILASRSNVNMPA